MAEGMPEGTSPSKVLWPMVPVLVMMGSTSWLSGFALEPPLVLNHGPETSHGLCKPDGLQCTSFCLREDAQDCFLLLKTKKFGQKLVKWSPINFQIIK